MPRVPCLLDAVRQGFPYVLLNTTSLFERFFVMVTIYVLQSINTYKLYVGMTEDLVNRLKEHNAGKGFIIFLGLLYCFIVVSFAFFLNKLSSNPFPDFLGSNFGFMESPSLFLSPSNCLASSSFAALMA